jgi:hypothetical protein
MNVFWKRGWYRIGWWWKELTDYYYTIKYACQRVTKGYDDFATYLISGHLATLIPAMLKELRDRGYGYPCGIMGHQAVAVEDDDPELAVWRATLDEIIVGFEAAEHLINRDDPAREELYKEWEKRFPGRPPHYFDETTRTEDGSIQMKTHPEYYDLEKELDVKQRDDRWRKEQLKLFHRGMYLFHKYFFDFWD